MSAHNPAKNKKAPAEAEAFVTKKSLLLCDLAVHEGDPGRAIDGHLQFHVVSGGRNDFQRQLRLDLLPGVVLRAVPRPGIVLERAF